MSTPKAILAAAATAIAFTAVVAFSVWLLRAGVQVWHWWWPFWMQCWGQYGPANTSPSIEMAETFARRHAAGMIRGNSRVVKNLTIEP